MDVLETLDVNKKANHVKTLKDVYFYLPIKQKSLKCSEDKYREWIHPHIAVTWNKTAKATISKKATSDFGGPVWGPYFQGVLGTQPSEIPNGRTQND